MDQNLKYAVDFVEGKLTYDEFECLFLQYPEIWDRVQELLTDALLDAPEHPFWTKSNRSRMEASGYSVRSAALAFGWDEYGKRVAHQMIGDLVENTFPEIRRRNPPEQSLDDLLEKLGMDYLGGEEVEALVADILSGGQDITPAKERNRLLKEQLREAFHLKPRKVPRWAQSAQWPMGQRSPMAFVDQKREGERNQYVFRDADTGEIKVIEQFY